MTTQANMTPVSVRLSPDMRQAIATMAVQQRRSFHAQMLVLLDTALAQTVASQGVGHGETGTPEPLFVPAARAYPQVSAG